MIDDFLTKARASERRHSIPCENEREAVALIRVSMPCGRSGCGNRIPAAAKRFDDVVVGGVRKCKAQVASNGPVEERQAVRPIADCRTNFVRIELAHVVAAKAHSADVLRVKSRAAP